MAHLNLDAARAARREVAGEPVTFTFGGDEFVLPVEMPLAALDVIAGIPEDGDPLAQAAAMAPLVRAMLGEEDWARFARHRPTMEDVVVLSEHLWAEYAVDPQTPSRSQRRARATSQRSKQTSSRTTGSTPARRSTAASR